ncbi:uncharacterized protein TNCV_3680851 [Trichonephila clavipes]|nr:uncharacterized protein TNCV_3680851 [Trichonephila clavipes]
MLDIKIDDNCPFEEIKRQNAYLNSNKLEQYKISMLELIKDGREVLNHFKNEHFPYDNLFILVEFSLCSSGTSAAVERVFSVGNDFGAREKSRLNVDILDAVITVKHIFSKKVTFCSEISDVIENDTLTTKNIQWRNTRLSKRLEGMQA